MSKNIIVGMSGGVDSSTVALLLKQQGENISGVFMKNWVELHGKDDSCAAMEDLADAQAVCDHIGIDLKAINFAPEYWDHVFSHFLAEYERGRTPNPDILCNKEIKFKRFLQAALDSGADKIATGHYARIAEKDGQYFLLKGVDHNKDQSYFLYTLGQQALSRSLFPLGEMSKPQVRDLAKEADLPTFAKKDSTGICFIGERNFTEFLSQYLPARPGDIVTIDGDVIGQHQGLMYYTLGQRKGIGIGGMPSADESPWFVVGKYIQDNLLVVAQGHDHPALHSTRIHVQDLSWVSAEAPRQLPFDCAAKTRYRQQDQPCRILELTDDHCLVEFERPQRAVTPGQSMVFYQGDICLGGGIIDRVEGIIYQ